MLRPGTSWDPQVTSRFVCPNEAVEKMLGEESTVVGEKATGKDQACPQSCFLFP